MVYVCDLLYLSHSNAPDAVSIDKTRSLIMELDAKGILEECETWYAISSTLCAY